FFILRGAIRRGIPPRTVVWRERNCKLSGRRRFSMADQYRKPLTEEQRETLKPTFDRIEQLFEELSGKLTEIGRDEPGEDHCFFCRCTLFVPGGGGAGGILRRCARPSCRHSLIAHWT